MRRLFLCNFKRVHDQRLLVIASRGIVIPKQLKAFSAPFSRQDRGERAGSGPVPVLQNVTALYNHSPMRQRTATIDAFSEMGLDVSVREALQTSFGISEPSPVQQLAVPVGCERNVAVFVGAPSGTGKTVACLAPAYSNMVKDRDVYNIPTREFRPRMIVLAPTREVLKQTHHVCKKLDAATGLRSVCITRTKGLKRKIRRLLRGEGAPVDVLVMHPHMVLKLIRHHRLFIDDLRYLIVDEADEMLSAGQDHYTQQLIAKIQKRILFQHLPPVETQLYFASTNITRRMSTYLNRKFPHAVHCVARGIHKPPENIKFKFYPIKRSQAKFEMLEYLLMNKTRNFPKNQAQGTDCVGLTPAVIERPKSTNDEEESTGIRQLGSPGDNSVDEQSYKAWLSDKKMEKNREHSNSSSSLTQSISSPPVPVNVVTTDLNNFEISNRSFAQGAGVSKFDDAVRSRLRSEVSKALAIPSSRRYGSAGLVRPAVRWENVLTHASPFQFYIPQTFVPQSGLRVMIFLRDIDSCAAIYFKLKGLGYKVTLVHASLPEHVRNEMLTSFASGACNILCCTNVMARGVDIPVDVVINFDLPNSAGLFLNRAGRCGRMGRPGTCYSLYHAKKDSVMASALSALIHTGTALHGVSNEVGHMNNPRYKEWSRHHQNQLARAYVTMISKASIPSRLVKTYIRHNAMWRPLYHPHSTTTNHGVAPRQQERIMASVWRDAINFRKLQLAKRKGGRAKFGKTYTKAVWSWKGGVERQK